MDNTADLITQGGLNEWMIVEWRAKRRPSGKPQERCPPGKMTTHKRGDDGVWGEGGRRVKKKGNWQIAEMRIIAE
jgi:hypothetical protein